MSQSIVEGFSQAQPHRDDCCDYCGIADVCPKITARCWPDGGVAENCSKCRRCPEYQNQFIKRPIVITEVP